MRNIKMLVVTGLVISGLFLMSSCEKQENEADNLGLAQSDAYGFYSDSVVFVETGELTNDEIESLVFMKEEEKLARDVYYLLHHQWGTRVFSNIAGSEESHMAAVLRLMGFYGLEDTTVLEPGVFNNTELAMLYTELTAQGSLSLEEALIVGAMIEELDIRDLQDYLGLSENENITLVYGNLLRGSRNHLRAFNRQLVNLGITYQPRYLTQEQFDEIANSTMEGGFGYGNGQGKGKGKGYQSGKQNSVNGECDGTGSGRQQKGKGKGKRG